MCKSVAKSIANVVNPITSITTGILGDKLLGGGGGSLPGVPDPAYLQQIQVPAMTPQELQTLQKMGINVDQLAAILSGEQSTLAQNQNILRQFSGLYDANGNLNQTAVNDLRDRILSTQQQTNQLNQQSLAQLANTFNRGQLEGASDQVGLAELSRLQAALSGELEPTNAILNQEKKEFERLKEAAGQRGIKIEGDDLYSSTSQSTAGNQLLNDLRSNFAARRDSERQNIINQATGANLNRLGFGLNRQDQIYNQAQGLRSDPYTETMGFMREAQGYSPANLVNSYGSLQNQYLNYANPYAQQRLTEYDAAVNNATYNNQLRNSQITGNYNRDLQNYQDKQNQRNAIFGTIGTIGGALVGSLGGPAGATAGAALGNQVMTGGQQSGGYVPTNFGMGFAAPRARTQVSYGNYQPYNAA